MWCLPGAVWKLGWLGPQAWQAGDVGSSLWFEPTYQCSIDSTVGATNRKGHVVAEFIKASGDVLASRRALAEIVRDQLVRAGIPASFGELKRVLGGAVIEVDEGDDQASGVFVRWECAADLVDLAADAVYEGQFGTSCCFRGSCGAAW